MLFDVTAVADALKPFSDFSYCGIDITPLLLTTRRGSRNARVGALKSMNFKLLADYAATLQYMALIIVHFMVSSLKTYLWGGSMLPLMAGGPIDTCCQLLTAHRPTDDAELLLSKCHTHSG
jgi:hypothetical protein